MPKKALKVLGINPGTRYIGIACFEGDSLIDWGIKVINGKWSRKKRAKATEIISMLIEYYQPDAVSVKKLHSSRISNNLSFIADEIARQAKKNRLRFRRYSIKEIKSFFCPGKKTNRKKIIKHLTATYPVLHREMDREDNSNNTYHLRMFEAVALAVICIHRLTK